MLIDLKEHIRNENMLELHFQWMLANYCKEYYDNVQTLPYILGTKDRAMLAITRILDLVMRQFNVTHTSVKLCLHGKLYNN